MSIARALLEQAYRDACEVELRAFKPGNVSIHSEGHDMTVEDFRRSAQASAPPLCDPALSLGERIYQAVLATRETAGCNTNLGIILLAAPLLLACQVGRSELPLRNNLFHVLEQTTREDAEWVFRAICLAEPGGLGESSEQDVRAPPSVTLREAMNIAAHRDRIARQYITVYADVFDFAIPSYYKALSRWGDEEWAAVAVFAGLLKAIPDSHIERKFGTRYTRKVAERMAQVDEALSAPVESERLMQLLEEVDEEFKSSGINPGTTADLTVTCLLAVRLESLWPVKAAGG
ncbi:triphosphoribosyl-dephospho-CoA synthase [Methylococcus sp. EFPC2]|uniref:triphosphoribosyl-dephospho-CoA synthase n=1 Tax=Methylococcus sp. EFPC2 TaxID=2812648 RepID=UPI001966FA1C|nr:triphosphoribosyl-dephospho-CoA synthase [Methylococcus sp. EFPC2]QSA96735.1 triphosphoribosyl-dephospho-CoA synthase [Methylococcus sp. EFPC2]